MSSPFRLNPPSDWIIFACSPPATFLSPLPPPWRVPTHPSLERGGTRPAQLAGVGNRYPGSLGSTEGTVNSMECIGIWGMHASFRVSLCDRETNEEEVRGKRCSRLTSCNAVNWASRRATSASWLRSSSLEQACSWEKKIETYLNTFSYCYGKSDAFGLS